MGRASGEVSAVLSVENASAILEIPGAEIRTKQDFHNRFLAHPTVPGFYGRNLDALWDAITGLVERPFHIVWTDASLSRERLGADFDALVRVMRDAEAGDRDRPANQRFELHLID